MNESQVPQDNIAIYEGHKKVVYAQNASGEYCLTQSSGWSVEEEATMQAVEELQRLAQEARLEVEAGVKSPLYFHMYDKRMDMDILSQCMGIMKWRLKRHFKPSVFAKLRKSIIERYADAFGITVDEVKTLPPRRDDG